MNRYTWFAFSFLGIVWGTNFIFMRWASELISPIQVVFLRVLFGFVPVFCYACLTKALNKDHLRYLPHFIAMALLATVIYYWAFASGSALLPSGVSGVLSGCIPLFSFIMAALFLRQERITLIRLTGITIGFIGIVIIARPWSDSAENISLYGIGYMILGSLSVGGSFVYAKRFLSHINIPPVALATYQIGIALLILALITPFDGMQNLYSSYRASIGLVLGLGILGTGIAYLTYYFLILRLGAVSASSVTYLPPVIALLIGFFFANEPIGYVEILSIALISSGVFILQKQK